MLELLNDPSFVRYIGDKGVRTREDARLYILNGPLASYEKFGFGLYLVELKENGRAIGICGLVKREWLADVDVGYAFLPAYRSKGYAFEAAAAVKSYAFEVLGLKRLVAITNHDNEGSIRVLERIGLKYAGTIRTPAEDTELSLYASEA